MYDKKFADYLAAKSKKTTGNDRQTDVNEANKLPIATGGAPEPTINDASPKLTAAKSASAKTLKQSKQGAGVKVGERAIPGTSGVSGLPPKLDANIKKPGLLLDNHPPSHRDVTAHNLHAQAMAEEQKAEQSESEGEREQLDVGNSITTKQNNKLTN